MRLATMKIGDLAERTGTTPRTIRYYEELGLLARGSRAKGQHRVYDDADVERLAEIRRLRDLLGLELHDVKELLEAEDARAELRRRFHETEDPAERRRILEYALPHVEQQLQLVRSRKEELVKLESELIDRRRRIRTRLRGLR
jgi:MerR family transcriptional regulator, repressor of the yfmOP operon